MMEPLRENIDGSKQVVHTVEHRVNWGYVALGVAAIVVALTVASRTSTRQDDRV